MSIFRWVLDALAGSGGEADARARKRAVAIPAVLRQLDQIRPGLAAAVHAYIEGDGDAIVLASLGQRSVLRGSQHVPSKDDTGIQDRRRGFAHPDADPGWVARYVKVLAADIGTTRARSGLPPSSDKVMPDLRILLGELMLRPADMLPDGKVAPPVRLPLRQTEALLASLGASMEDLFDVVFYKDTGYGSYNGLSLAKILDLPDLVKAHPSAFMAQNDRLPIPGRVQLFDFLGRTALAGLAPFSEMVIDGLGDSSKAIREAALKAFATVDPAQRLSTADALLDKGSADLRGSMVEALIALGDDAARARLARHLDAERTARIRTLIEGYLQATGSEAGPVGLTPEEEGRGTVPGYRALDGSFVEIPPLAPPDPAEPVVITAEMRAELLAMGIKLEDQYQRDLAAPKPPYYLKYASSLAPTIFAAAAEKCVRGEVMDRGPDNREVRRRLMTSEFRTWLAANRAALPETAALNLQILDMTQVLLPKQSSIPGRSIVELVTLILGGRADYDLRHLELALDKANYKSLIPGSNYSTRTRRSGELLYTLFLEFGFDRSRYYESPVDDIPSQSVWPLVAQNLWLADISLGLVADDMFKVNKAGALDMLAALPKLPAKYAALLLDLAMTAPKDLRKAAAAILKRNQGYEEQLVTLLGDSRQDLRVAAAKWLSDIGHRPAIGALQKQLKTEKSIVVKAAILSALKALGEDVSAHLGPDALLAEARAGLPKASFKDVDWLDLASLPTVHYRDGAPVPPDVPRWWVALAAKLKTPGDTAIFDPYLDQLDPADAVRLSTFLFDSWFAHDLSHPSQAEADAYALATLPHVKSWWKNHFEARRDWTDEQILAQLRRDKLAETPNSGASAKGLLALGGRVPSTHAVAKVRSYLRKHGGRTSQTVSLLELMAARGDAMSLQVVIAAATRLRQKGVQAKANEMVQAVADRNDWTLDQLADRTVPTGGLEDDGTLDLPCAGGDRIYVARLDDKLGLALFNPEGKPVKALPAGQDEETQASVKALSAARKEIKQAIDFQTTRLFEAMCIGRSWSVEDWTRDFHGHPLMRKLTERLIWQGLDASGAPVGSFRPTAEGDFVDTGDADVDLAGFAALRLGHASTLTEHEIVAWRSHMKDYSVAPIFDQVREDLPRLTQGLQAATQIDDRQGWVFDTFTLRGEATRAGWERGDALDGGGFDCYLRHFASVGIVAVIEFTGNHVEQENIPAALKTLSFERLAAGKSRGYGAGQSLKLGQVPPVLLAECWADLHRIARKAAFDPNWEKVSPW